MSSELDAMLVASEEEALRKQQKPFVSVEQAVEIAEELFGLTVDDIESVRELDSYDDKNFFMRGLLSDGTAGAFTLKVHNGVESANMDILECQNAALEHLASNSYQVPAPQLSVDNSTIAFKVLDQPLPEDPEEEPPLPLEHAVRLLSWVEGPTMSSMEPKADNALLFKAGVYLADMTNCMMEFDHIGAHRTHSWDLLNTPNILAFKDTIEDDSRRDLVQSVVSAFQGLAGFEQQVPWGVLQADFNDANIIVDDGRVGLSDEELEASKKQKVTYKIAGVIDFGDIVYSCQINELAIAMAYHMLGQVNPIQAAAALYSGYCSVRQLLPAEQKALHTLVACRLAISVTNGAYSLSQEPENDYLRLHAEPAWGALELWWVDTPKEEIEQQLAGALVSNAYGI